MKKLKILSIASLFFVCSNAYSFWLGTTKQIDYSFSVSDRLVDYQDRDISLNAPLQPNLEVIEVSEGDKLSLNRIFEEINQQ